MVDSQSESQINKKDIDLYKRLFIGRDDVFAEQIIGSEGAYYNKVSRPITDSDITEHLLGRKTYGAYIVDTDNTCRCTVFDIDISKEIEINETSWRQVRAKVTQLKIKLIELGFTKKQILVEESGRRGYHVWIIFSEPLPCQHAYAFAKFVAGESGINCEFFPKQGMITPESGFGSLIKLPCGVHKATGRRSQFVDSSFTAYQNQFDYLKTIEPVPKTQIEAVLSKYNISLEVCRPVNTQANNVEFNLDTKGASIDSLVSNCKALSGLKEKAEKTKHLTHTERVALVNIFPLFGSSGEERLHKIMVNCADYDPQRTQHEIEYRIKKEYKPLTCQKLKDWSICSCECGLKPKTGAAPSPIQISWDKKDTESPAQKQPAADGVILEPACNHFDELIMHCRRTAGDGLIGIPTHYPILDRMLGGIRGMWAIGGMPKVGKSMYVAKLAMNIAENGNQVIYLDFENGINKILLRMLSCISRVTAREILINPNSLLNRSDLEQVKKRFFDMTQNLFIHRPSLQDLGKDGKKAPDLTKKLLKQYISCIRDRLRRTGKIIFIIDSLQKLPLWDISNRRSDIDAWLRAIEVIRDEMDVAFIVVSELSRTKYDDASISAYKESGDIEYSSDVLMQLQKVTTETGEEVLELNCIANRDGESGIVADYRPLFEFCDFEEIPNNMYREEIRRGR